MTNKEIANQFSLLSKIMEIHGENSFKAKSYSIAAYKINQLPVELSGMAHEEIFKLSGIGEATGKKIVELITTGKMEMLEKLAENTPQGVLEMLKIKGLGSKKIGMIWKDMQIESIGELLYACNENRLLLYSGFGKKTQENVIESIEFYLSQQGSFLYAQVEKTAMDIKELLQQALPGKKVAVTGDFIRQAETVDILEYVVEASAEEVKKAILAADAFSLTEEGNGFLLLHYHSSLQIKIHLSTPETFAEKVFETTGSEAFVKAFRQQFAQVDFKKAVSENDIFEQAAIPYIVPCLREEGFVISAAAGNHIPQLISPSDIKGIIHCHSKWSDGSNTIEELARACILSGKEYLVLSDHSRSAAYANGLTEERIREQHVLIDQLNEQLKPFRVFKSIESDILNDGSLDYSDSVLSTFDLVIASVHSNLKMNEEKAMSRLMRAIENPYTTILGHMTGRLLLSRKGFPVDHKKIIDACAANHVIIELNAHPRRLDIRWQWIPYALSKNVLLSINPDAHSVPEFDNTRYGVLAAQKAMVTSAQNLSSFGLKEFEETILSLKK